MLIDLSVMRHAISLCRGKHVHLVRQKLWWRGEVMWSGGTVPCKIKKIMFVAWKTGKQWVSKKHKTTKGKKTYLHRRMFIIFLLIICFFTITSRWHTSYTVFNHPKMIFDIPTNSIFITQLGILISLAKRETRLVIFLLDPQNKIYQIPEDCPLHKQFITSTSFWCLPSPVSQSVYRLFMVPNSSLLHI